MKTLVTGAGGFIGSHLAKELLRRGCKVRGLFMPTEDAEPLKTLGIEVFEGDLTTPETLGGVAENIDTVYHLATRTLDWGTQKQFESIMVGGTKNLLEESKGKISRFVYFSSVAAFGIVRDVAGFNEDAQRIKCGIPYCDTKITAEDMVKDFCTQNRMDYTIIRPANVIGPGSVWVREIIEAFYRAPFPLVNKGTAPGAFVYIDNLVAGSILAAESEKGKGSIYHFRDDYDITWFEYLTRIGSLIGKKPRGNLPFWLARTLGSLCERVFVPFNSRPPMTRLAAGILGKNLDVDNTKAKKELGWKTTVGLEEALNEIERWVNEEYLPSRQSQIP